MSGRLITLEGGEGAGKSTQVAVVAEWLRQRGRGVVTTREPGGTPLAEAIRGLVLADWEEGVTATTEGLLMFAARAAHWASLIEPRLQAGMDVVCDRFVDSSWAYQGAKGLPDAALEALTALVLGARRPQLTLLLDLPPELGLARARARGGANRFEAADLALQSAIRQRFLARARAEPERFVVIDASASQHVVAEAVRRALEDRLA